MRQSRPTPQEGDELDEILAGCRSGSSEAFGRLFELYKDYVYSVAVYLTRDESLAGDIVQEVFLKLLDRIDRFEGRSRWSTWLYRVVCNAVWDARRSARPHVSLEAAPGHRDLQQIEAPQERALDRKASARKLRRMVVGLSPKLRTPLVLRYVAGLRYEEIAAVLDVSSGTVSSRLNRAHKRLAELLPRDKVVIR